MTPVDKGDAAAVRNAFARRLAETRAAFAVAGEDGLARVASQTMRERLVTLLWSQRGSAGLWAPVVATKPRIKDLTLIDLFTEILPKLAEMKRLVGPDWSADPIEPEVEPAELIRLVRHAMLDDFIRTARESGYVWVLQGVEGPACRVSLHPNGGQLLPVWADRPSAETRIEGPWRDMVPARITIGDFRQRTLMWATETRKRIAPAYCEGAGLLELEPWDVKARLNPARSDRVVA